MELRDLKEQKQKYVDLTKIYIHELICLADNAGILSNEVLEFAASQIGEFAEVVDFGNYDTDEV